MKTDRPGWTKIGTMIAGITLVVMVIFGILQLNKSTKPNTIKSNRNVQVEGSDKTQIAQGNNNTQKTQNAQGNEITQIQGNNNIINKGGQIILKTEANSRLTYSVTKLKHTNEGKYQRTVSIRAVGNVPVFTPQILIIFDKAVKKVITYGPSLPQASEDNTDGLTGLGKDTFYLKAGEIIPGPDYKFEFTNDSEFNVIKVRLNDQDLKPSLAEPD